MVNCPYCGSADVEVVRTWKMRNYTVTHYRCRACGDSFNHYKDPSTGKEFMLRSRRRTDYSRKTLSSGIGELIEDKLRGRYGRFGHDDLVGMVKDIGGWLGFRVEAEYRIDNFRVDAVFFKKPRTVPYAVAEVHVGGDVFKDLASLKHAYDKYGSLLIYVVARDEDAVARLVNEAVRGAFHEIKDKLIMIRADELRRLHEALSNGAVRKFVNALITK